MGSVELVANLFRITQTQQKLINDNIKTEKATNNTHYTVGKKVRNAIADIGGTMLGKLSKPQKSLKELEKEKFLDKKTKEIKN